MTNSPKIMTGRTMPREPWHDNLERMSPEEGKKVRRELGGARIRFIPKKDIPKNNDGS